MTRALRHDPRSNRPPAPSLRPSPGQDGVEADWRACLPQLMAVIAALHEPSPAMMEAGAEIVRYVGAEESEEGHRSDAANIWRFMIEALRHDAAVLQGQIAR
ncbi:hypothetical protein K3M67_21470 (plasmid) [Sphingobium sp. V4]|uniref:hypothetical protein n=1 Tax=Sphingobium sp. V4 TaxID=3038927 RepID=UPI002557EE9D|nr:hypothetical protein [Sphingobium sp. V4]WIW91132.1 hypothetical protein K3M67_21470 [Sphingobium sp. V4]